MRVAGGEWGGLPIIGPKKPVLRPTEDRVRQALFNILGPRVHDTIVLDAFAGTGALAIEALSRGAMRAVLVDKHPHALGLIRENLASVGVSPERFRVFSGDVLQWLRRKELISEGPFDLIFLDPPYEMDLYKPVLSLIAEIGLLKTEGLVVLEYSTRRPSASPQEPWRCLKSRTYGETTLAFWSLLPKEEEMS